MIDVVDEQELQVDAVHPEYAEHESRWQKVADCVEGEEAVKKRGTEYLPALDSAPTGTISDLTGEAFARDYRDYLTRATFMEACSRTQAALTGMIMGHQPGITFSDDALAEDVGSQGESIDQIARWLIGKLLTVGRAALVVDAPPEGEEGEPFIATYDASSLVNWRVTRARGREQLTLAVFKETADVVGEDGYEHALEDRWREFRLQDGIYVQKLWRKKDNNKFELVGDEVFPRFNASTQPLEELPIVIVNSLGVHASVDDAPMLGMANTVLSMFRNSADLEHGSHKTALPTAVLTGANLPQGQSELRLGSGSAIVLPDKDAKTTYLEFTGAGLRFLVDLIKEKRDEIAALGARFLEASRTQTEATDTHRLRREGERSILENIAMHASEGMTRALNLVEAWRRSPTSAQYELNSEFGAASLDPTIVAGLLSLVQQGRMSDTAFFFNMQGMGAYPRGHTFEDEMKLIEAQVPAPVPPDAFRNGEDES